ncbi:hypothetical protein [Devosia alba]|uniref:hypothetical protein n=2 Tax=Devosia TaxID=46913 RepID=UPI003262E1E6
MVGSDSSSILATEGAHGRSKEAVMRPFAAVVVVALTLGVGLVGPAQAQRFGIFYGDQRSDFFPERISCLNDFQIRQAVAELGYRDIYLNVPNQKHIEVRASKGDWVYLLDFNYCSARIESRTRLRPAR